MGKLFFQSRGWKTPLHTQFCHFVKFNKFFPLLGHWECIESCSKLQAKLTFLQLEERLSAPILEAQQFWALSSHNRNLQNRAVQRFSLEMVACFGWTDDFARAPLSIVFSSLGTDGFGFASHLSPVLSSGQMFVGLDLSPVCLSWAYHLSTVLGSFGSWDVRSLDYLWFICLVVVCLLVCWDMQFSIRPMVRFGAFE